jgi:two-component system phosphate regulon response regulator PhoB
MKIAMRRTLPTIFARYFGSAHARRASHEQVTSVPRRFRWEKNDTSLPESNTRTHGRLTTLLGGEQLGDADCKTVLVVDDDRDIREVITEALESEAYRVVASAHGQEALDWLRAPPQSKPCVILLELLRDPVLRTIPVVVLLADPSAIAATTSLNFAGHLKKPIRLEALLAVVGALCGPCRGP